MNNFEKGWAIYEKGKRMIEDARGWPKQKEKKIKEGMMLILLGAKLAHEG